MGRELKKGDNIKFVSGNFQGLFATVIDVDYDSKDKSKHHKDSLDFVFGLMIFN
jgi:transcription antitermination factor NusG